MKNIIWLYLNILILWSCTASNSTSIRKNELKNTDLSITEWCTKGDHTELLNQSKIEIGVENTPSNRDTIFINPQKTFQTIDGFGFTLTGGSAYNIYQLPDEKRNALLQELFGSNEKSIGISYLRISIGASDLDAKVFSYDDLPEGSKDPELTYFSLNPDSAFLIPLLKEIISINPKIKILGSPWSPPVWMKTNGKTKGGSLSKEYYGTYAHYFVKYIQQMRANGIVIDAITPQNEPLHPGNNPSMYMTAYEQADFIKNHLGPVFKSNGIQTKIIVYDHNCNKPEYPIEILDDADAKIFVDGSAFHLYEGDISALSTVHAKHPDRNLYFTEQWTGSKGSFNGDLLWHMKNVVIGSMRNWSKIALEWNLANDASFGPHTPGGCTECKGALTIDTDIERNVSYYIIAHAAKFIPPGSVRVESSNNDGLDNVAFLREDGKKVLIVVNDKNSDRQFSIKINGQFANRRIPAESVVTYIW